VKKIGGGCVAAEWQNLSSFRLREEAGKTKILAGKSELPKVDETEGHT